MLIPAYYKDRISLNSKTLSLLKNYKTIALFAAVQFIKLEEVEKQLKELGITVLVTHGKRTSGKYQLLGCDCFSDSFAKDTISEADAILYIGDGLFHPKALMLSQRGKEPKDVILFDPRTETVKKLKQQDMNKQVLKYKANLVKYLSSKKIGILVSTKTGQQYLKNALLLKEQTEKEAYIFIDDTFNYQFMENYPFIEVWVNTACPRIGTDDITHMPKPLININDAFNPTTALEKLEHA